MDEKKVQHAINTRYAPDVFSEDKINYAVIRMQGGEIVKKKVSVGFVLAIVLLLATVTALAATLWPSFIKEKFAAEEPTVRVGMLALIEQLKGVDLAGETEVDDVKMRTHYAIVDGPECIVLFSLQNAKPNMPSVEERLFVAEVDFQIDDETAAGGRCSITRWYDEEEGVLYCLAYTPLEGGALPATGDVQMTLSVITEIPVESQEYVFEIGEPIWSITAAVPVGAEIPTKTLSVGSGVSFGQTTLTITQVDLRTTGATVHFEGNIVPSDDGKPRSLIRLFGFEWTGDEKDLPLSLSGASSREVDGVTYGKFTFQGVLTDLAETLLLNVWMREDPNNVQSVPIQKK